MNTAKTDTSTKTEVRLLIDGKGCAAYEGETVLDAAHRAGIEIPALCQIEDTAPWGACRLCLVEVEGVEKLQAACTTWVGEGLKVKTDSPRIRAKRESYLRMYLSDHNAYCEAPCAHACPTHIDIPGYLEALAAGDLEKATGIVRAELPFPGILGRICPAYCESVCRRGDVDEPIAICALHRALADHGGTPTATGTAEAENAGHAGVSDTASACAPGPQQSSGKRVAVVGTGPAGLSAAWFLTKRGHQVTAYDMEAKPGGLLRYMIPEFRLPEKVLDEELEPLWKAGARFVGQSKFAGHESPEGLLDAGFDAVIVSTGQEQAKEPPGSQSAAEQSAAKQSGAKTKVSPTGAPLSAGDFLRAARAGDSLKVSSSVVVVGGGTTALDTARTVLRLGAGEVTVATRHDATSLPAGERDLQAAMEEGVKFQFGVDETESAASAAKGATVIRAIEPAAGERPDANRYTGRTATDGVFVATESITGTRSAIHAVAAGKRAALAADAWLRGQDLTALENDLATYTTLPYLEQLQEDQNLGGLGRRLAERAPVWLKMGTNAEPAARSAMPTTPVEKQLKDMNVEVEQGLALASAQEEAKRCLQCVCPSLGECDLQRLGVEYDITANPLVTNTSRVRAVEPQYEHPFIRRSMDRCISCGRCVRVCREVAGPACYDFTGRGFAIKVDTPYSDSLQLADCISCGRCVTACPTGALTFNERRLESFRVDESRCIMCRECVQVCPVEALEETNQFEEARRKWLELVGQGSGLAGGHRMCAGCGAPVVVRQVLMGTEDPVVVGASTGCLEVSTTIYPYTSWKGGYIHTAFENVAATISGVETAFRALKKKGAIDENVKFIAFGGDGGTYDIGLQSLSGAMERGHRMLYVCYDNGAYMNTGFQRSGATPISAWTTTSPVGKESPGKAQNRKNLTELMIAHGLPYVAQASPHDPRDLVRKAAKALSVDGPTFLNVLSPCPRGWRSDGAESIDLAREAVNTCYWPLFEYEDGVYRLTYRPHHKLPLIPWLKRQGRFAHLFKPGFENALASIETWVDAEWDKLLRKCGEPSEADWQAHLQQDGCLLR